MKEKKERGYEMNILIIVCIVLATQLLFAWLAILDLRDIVNQIYPILPLIYQLSDIINDKDND